MGSALFLAWDRYQIDSGLKSSDLSVHDLVDVSKKAQLHKLIGIPAGDLLDYVDQIGPEYLRAGAIDRFSGALESIDVPDYEPTLRGRPPKPRKVRTYRKAFILKRTEQEERSVVERRQETREVQQRDATTAANLKEMYFFRCMFCDIALTVDIDVPRYYAEAAHIQALGKPDDGPDVPENMLVLCPNHHKQFDNGVLFLTWKSASTLKLHSKIPGDVLDGKEVHLERGHTVDSQYVNHHRKKWS
ncbi:MAG: HNH endonuclease [Gammaproteobacteria bacterium]|nr:HNH endonuclease [Gammaproteobacteria bacterium]